MKLYILIATYNGEKYIEDLINSIVSQKGTKSSHILIRDDNSNDNTLDIIERIANGHKNIEIIRDSLGNLNVKGNFNQLVTAAIERDADYVMFADQDDIWKEDKIEKTFKCMQKGESEFKTNTPLLVHTDLCVVDDNLKVIHPSFMKYQRIHHMDSEPIKTLLVQNFVTGCTIMANRALLKIAHPVPDGAIMHDWWYALCAASSGKILHVPEVMVFYRQHDYNKIGAKEYWQTLGKAFKNYYVTAVKKIFSKNENIERANSAIDFINSTKQAECLLNHVHNKLKIHSDDVNVLQKYCCIIKDDSSAFRKIIKLHRLGIRRQDFIRNIALKLVILLS